MSADNGIYIVKHNNEFFVFENSSSGVDKMFRSNAYADKVLREAKGFFKREEAALYALDLQSLYETEYGVRELKELNL